MPQWTVKQTQVIETRNKNILVSAAAGSGKTAVLVERIIQKVLDRKQPLDIDKILVVTFTNAAAAEMRERVLAAISEALSKEPENEHLQRQQTFIHNAHITTLHSFCLNLVREHFNDTDLDPGVRIADDNEIRLIKADVVKEILEEFYTRHEADFVTFVSQFEAKSSDLPIHNMILDLYHKAMGYPQPEKWLQSCIGEYQYHTTEELEQSSYMKIVKQYSDSILEEYLATYKTMLELCSNGGPDIYTETLLEEMDGIQAALRENRYDRRRTKLNMEFQKLKPCKKNSCDEDKKNQVKSLRDMVKSGIADLRKKLYANSLEKNLLEICQCREMMEVYVQLVLRFMERFAEIKHDKNIIDFNDFEHYALRVLVKEEDGVLIPTKAADELSAEFEEVMCDEYQDSNIVQETILAAVSKERFGIHNRFMVGDVKQSIYGFRGANPDIFVEKYNTYGLEGKNGNLKIILDQNFRSRQGVIDSTNFIFSHIMGKEFGNINYEEEKLNFGALFGTPDESVAKRAADDRTELLLIESKNSRKEIHEFSDDGEADASSNEIQAKVIADRIVELINPESGMVIYDKHMQNYRPLKYSDIAILARSCGDNADTILDEFMARGIPVSMETKSGYFKTKEIRLLISLLKIIDNPLQDIPMAEVLKAPFVDLEDNEIATVRAFGGKDESLYANILFYLRVGREVTEEDKLKLPEMEYDESLREKLRHFVDLLEDCRDKVSFMTIYELLCYLLERTKYEYYAGTMSSSRKRIANIEMLKTKAKDYENGSYQGLFHFIRYIDKMNTYELDMGEAQIANDSFDAVKIMTIHKSKGLEFPVVFLVNLNKSFNFSDAYGKCIIHSKLGVGMDYLEEDTNVRSKNIIKSGIAKQIELDAIEEEMRLFYVACTRAKEKLIMVAPNVKAETLRALVSQRENPNFYLGYGVVSTCKSYLDFVIYPLSRNEAFDGIYREVLNTELPMNQPFYRENSNFDVRYITMEQLFEQMIECKVEEGGQRTALSKLDTSMVYNENVQKQMERHLTFVYNYMDETLRHAKFSVSEIKKISHEISDEGVQEARLEVFAETERKADRKSEQTGKISGASRGTIYHKFFEKFDYHVIPDYAHIEKMREDLVAQNQMTKEEAEAIYPGDFVKFGKTKLYQKMRQAQLDGRLYREQQFVVGFTESEIESYEQAAKRIGENGSFEQIDVTDKTGDIVLIQGVIDAYYIENNRLYIIDYKTDYVECEEDLKKNYYIQLKLYGDALSKILGIPVGKKLIYSTRLGKEIEL